MGPLVGDENPLGDKTTRGAEREAAYVRLLIELIFLTLKNVSRHIGWFNDIKRGGSGESLCMSAGAACTLTCPSLMQNGLFLLAKSSAVLSDWPVQGEVYLLIGVGTFLARRRCRLGLAEVAIP